MSGFALIEVLIALFLISFGIINLLQAQIKLNSMMTNIEYRDLAMFQCIAIVQRFRVNVNEGYRHREIYLWNEENASRLPQGLGKIQCNGLNCLVEIDWKQGSSQCIKMQLHL